MTSANAPTAPFFPDDPVKRVLDIEIVALELWVSFSATIDLTNKDFQTISDKDLNLIHPTEGIILDIDLQGVKKSWSPLPVQLAPFRPFS